MRNLAFLSPWLLGTGLFFIYPLVSTVYFSFTHYNGFNTPTWVGLGNWKFVFRDYPFFWPALLNTLWYGPVYATAQSVVAPQYRATTAAILLFVLNLIGLGLGPLSVGALSDFLAGPMGLGVAEGVRWALILSCGCFSSGASGSTLVRAGLDSVSGSAKGGSI